MVPFLHRSLIAPYRLVIVFTLSFIALAGTLFSAPLGAFPIQIINTNAGRIMTAHADQYDGSVYVGGLVYRPSSPGIGPHVHVWGVDKNNKRVFFKTSNVLVTGKPSLIRSESYVVCFSPAVYDKAATIYVTFHSQSDADAKADF